MRAARTVLATLVTVSVVLAAVSVRVRRGEGGGFPPPSSGRLLPLDTALVGQPRVVGALGDGDLDEVVDVATAGDTVFMLSRTSWRVITRMRSRGPFGSPSAGAPASIARGMRIIAARGSVYILDGGRREVSRWSRDGTLLGRLSIGSPGRPFIAQDLAVLADGSVYVVAQEVERARARWAVLQLVQDAEPRVLRQASEDVSLFTQPRIAAAGDELLLFDPVSHARFALFAQQLRARTQTPSWETPDSLREQFARRAGRLSAAFGAPVALPDTMPSLQAAAVTRTGLLLTGTNPTGDALHVEVFRRDGTPLGRITADPVPAPVFLTADGVVRVAEEPRSIVFTLLPITQD